MKLGGKTLIIAGIVLVAMVLEAVMIVVLMPGNNAAASGTDTESAETAAEEPVLAAADESSAEALIDTFSCTNTRVAPGSVVHLSFKLVAVIPKGQELPFEEAANKQHKNRVRQAVERIARSASMDELNDPHLSTLKRLLREEVNKVLGRSFVNEMVINEFRMLEQ